MTKSEVLKALDQTPADMARMFGISTSAVSQWPDAEPLPLARQYELKFKLRPDVFWNTPIAEPTKAESEKAVA